MTTNNPLGQSGGWNVAKRGALLTLSHVRGRLVTAEDLVALGVALNQWARDPELYAVTLDESVLELACCDVQPAAAATLTEFTWRLECFSKPIISLMDGDVGEVGLSLALAGTHVVAGAGFGVRCPSFADGRLPPGMLMAALSRPGAGAALARLQAGGRISQVEALACGLAAIAINCEDFTSILDNLAAADPVDPVLDQRHAQPDATVADAPAREAKSTPFSSVIAEVAADIRRQDLGSALATVFRFDQALAKLGPAATPAALRAAAADVSLVLPSRRTLQDFRKS